MTRNDSSDISEFDREFLGGEEMMTRIGTGAIGGKAAGLKLIRDEILTKVQADAPSGFEITIPTLTVLTTEIFDKFITRNGLSEIGCSDAPDDRIAHAFLRAELPAEIVGDLRALIARVHTPLAIRSSSLLEDALEHPFAGVYATKMIPNNEIEEDARYRRLVEAIKLVYASTFFSDSKAYIKSVGLDIRQEKMAVIIQEVVGRRIGDRYYPAISGVARSYNYYPTGHARPEDGVINLALGLGRAIVDGGNAWTFCPEYPKAPPPFNNIGEMLKNTQTTFWAVNMGEPPLPDPLKETECMIQLDLKDAETDGVLKYLVSTFNAASDRLDPGLGGRGARVLNFAPILGSFFIPFNDILKNIIRVSAETLESAVEIELAIDSEPDSFLPARIGILQLRPMFVGDCSGGLPAEELTGPNVIIASTNVLGSGVRAGIRDIVYVKPEMFDPAETYEIADEIEKLNTTLVADGRPYVLIGFGRWGTSDPFFGIPVTWPQISGAKVIVEAALENMAPEMSQGSHFFHNVISFQILYFSVGHSDEHTINWGWLKDQELVTEMKHVRHVRSGDDLDIRVDGSARKGLLRHHE